MSESTCNHTFEVPQFDLPGDDRDDGRRWMLTEDVPGVSDRVWHCAHESISGQDTCFFHTDPDDRPEGYDETRLFLNTLEKAANESSRFESRRLLQFIDAEFTELSLRGVTVGTEQNHAINLAAATIGESDWTDARFVQPIRFSHATFLDELTARDVYFERVVGFRNATFESRANFRGAVFQAPVFLKHARFTGDSSFWYARFDSHANLRCTVFENRAEFKTADFADYANFTGAEFNGQTVFELVEFDDDAEFQSATFGGTHDFHGAVFNRVTDFSGVVVDGPLDLSAATFVDLRLSPKSAGVTDRCIDLRECEIDSGSLDQPKDGKLLYDLTDATVGDVQFTTPNGGAIADRVRFVRTRFNGFVFENDDLKPAAMGWKLCDVFDDQLLAPESREGPSTEARRQTFLNAKNGAQQTGNETAASAFFYRELTYRRQWYAELAQNADLPLIDRLWNATRWLRNGTMMLLTGYGERPDRVIYASLLTVSLFAGIYSLLLPTDEATAIDHLIFSFQSFVAFVPGTGIEESVQTVELVSSLQAFVGAFFIALFVFTFTRRINR